MASDFNQDRTDIIQMLPPLRDVIANHGLSAQKSLGQNFLLDMNITDKIVREAMSRDGGQWENIHGIEIGPGPGGLTRALLKTKMSKVTAIEFDKRAVQALDDLKDKVGDALEIIQSDALSVDLTSITDAPRVIVANLPYNIATPLLISWLKQIRSNPDSYQSMTLMFQKEVADRITAKVGEKAYGRLSIIAQWLCEVTQIYDLPPSAFTPPPKVKSCVVYMKPKLLPSDAPDFEAVERVTAAAFGQRRKMIRSSLKDYARAIEALGIDPQIRAENLTKDDYLKIAICCILDGPESRKLGDEYYRAKSTLERDC